MRSRPKRFAAADVEYEGEAGTRLRLRNATILSQLLDFALEFRFVLKAIVTEPAAQHFAAFPILEDTAQVFAGNSGHGREVALPDLVLDDDAVRSDSSQQRPPRWSRVGVG
jgi:hypothetical protein